MVDFQNDFPHWTNIYPFKDRPDVPYRVLFYPVPLSTPVFPYPSIFVQRNWDRLNKDEEPPLGTKYDLKEYYHGKWPLPRYEAPRGTPDQWANGVLWSEWIQGDGSLRTVAMSFGVEAEISEGPVGIAGDVGLKLRAWGCDYRGFSWLGSVALNLRPCNNEIDPSVIFGDVDLCFGVEFEAEEFDPTSIPGLIVWLDPTQEAYGDGDPVDLLTDWSGSGNDFEQPTGGLQPQFKTNAVGSLSAVKYNGTEYLYNPDEPDLDLGDDDFAIFIVLQSTSTAGTAVWIKDNNSASNNGPFISCYADDYYYVVNGSLYAFAPDLAAVRLIAAVRSGQGANQVDLRYDGAHSMDATDARTLSNTFAQLLGEVHGTSAPFEGYFCEVLIYRGSDILTQVADVEDYLISKWGI